jgi:hypothetical protein
MDRIKGKDGNWRPSEPISTYGGLVDFLSLFPREHRIAVGDASGEPRTDIMVEVSSISTVLSSEGEEIIW